MTRWLLAKSTFQLWLGFHIILFIVAISGVISNQFSGMCSDWLFCLQDFIGITMLRNLDSGRIKKLILVVVAVNPRP